MHVVPESRDACGTTGTHPQHRGEAVPELHPFAGIRYDLGVTGAPIGALTAPPYDVIDEDQRVTLEATHPFNSVRLILPRDSQIEGDRYDGASRTLAAWRAAGNLVVDPSPRLYGYVMSFRDPHGAQRQTVGVFGALGLPAAGDESILPHERTLPKAKSDRLALLRATRTNLDPIWGLSLTKGLSDLVDRSVPLAACTDFEGVEHTLYAIDDPARTKAITDAVARTPIVLADGHHRFETALAYEREIRDAAREPGGASAILAFVVELADEQLCIEPIHRLLQLPSDLDVRSALSPSFRISDAGANNPEGVASLEMRMAEEGGIGLADATGLALCTPISRRPERDPVASTDASLVEDLALPLLPGAEVTFRHDARTCAARVRDGAVGAALLLRPVSVADTRAAAEARLRMPQKTTFFRPKPRTGFVFRSLDI